MNEPSFLPKDGSFLYWIRAASDFVEVIAVVIIVFAVLWGTFRFLAQTIRKNMSSEQRYTQYRHGLGRALLVSLEILVAADVIRTVVLEFTLVNMAVLALLILMRTFLSWSLEVEMEGRWPWQSKRMD